VRARQSSATAGILSTRQVMVVEDDDDIRETVAAILIDEKYAVTAYRNGHLAFDALQGGERPGLILLDLMMPVMDGWEFRKIQLADPALASIPVVLVTAAGMERVRRDQFTEVLRKPLKLEQILNTVARFFPAPAADPRP
jgi:CheY-like chemotaxis protein